MITISESERTREYARKLGLSFQQTHSSSFGLFGEVSNEAGVLFGGMVEPHNQLWPLLYGYEAGLAAGGKACLP